VNLVMGNLCGVLGRRREALVFVALVFVVLTSERAVGLVMIGRRWC